MKLHKASSRGVPRAMMASGTEAPATTGTVVVAATHRSRRSPPMPRSLQQHRKAVAAAGADGFRATRSDGRGPGPRTPGAVTARKIKAARVSMTAGSTVTRRMTIAVIAGMTRAAMVAGPGIEMAKETTGAATAAGTGIAGTMIDATGTAVIATIATVIGNAGAIRPSTSVPAATATRGGHPAATTPTAGVSATSCRAPGLARGPG